MDIENIKEEKKAKFLDRLNALYWQHMVKARYSMEEVNRMQLEVFNQFIKDPNYWDEA